MIRTIAGTLVSMLTLLVLTGCASTSIQPKNPIALNEQAESVAKSVPTDGGQSISIPSGIDRFKWLRAKAMICTDGNQTGTCGDDIRKFLDAGISLSNDSCRNWLKWLIAIDADTSYNKGMLNIAGNAAQALMGLTGDAPEQIAKVALALGAVNAGYENYKSIYLLSTTLHKIKAQIMTGRETSASNLRDNATEYQSFGQAQEGLATYHDSCSREAILTLIDEGLKGTALAPPDTELTDENLQIVNLKLYRFIYDKSGQFSTDELRELVNRQADIFSATAPAPSDKLIAAAHARVAKATAEETSTLKSLLELLNSLLPPVPAPAAGPAPAAPAPPAAPGAAKAAPVNNAQLQELVKRLKPVRLEAKRLGVPSGK